MFCRKDGSRILSTKKCYERLLEATGIANATIHTLRHTYASHLVMNEIDIRIVQELLGHQSIAMTMRYAHLSDQFKQNEVRGFEI